MAVKPELIDLIPGNDFLGAVSYLNDLGWNLTILKQDDNWLLISGDKLLLTSDTEEELKSFVFGMAIGLAVLPESIMEQIRNIIIHDD
jgi:hypothetical protein